MASEWTEFIFNLIILTAFGLGGLGGYLLYRYRSNPKPKDYEKWKEKYKKKHGKEPEFDKLESGFVDAGIAYAADGYASAKDFGKGWRRKRIVALVMVLVGGAGIPASRVIYSMLGC